MTARPGRALALALCRSRRVAQSARGWLQHAPCRWPHRPETRPSALLWGVAARRPFRPSPAQPVRRMFSVDEATAAAIRRAYDEPAQAVERCGIRAVTCRPVF